MKQKRFVKRLFPQNKSVPMTKRVGAHHIFEHVQKELARADLLRNNFRFMKRKIAHHAGGCDYLVK
jgi:hypothetical protein